MALHEALLALQTGCSGLLTLKQDDPHFKKVRTALLDFVFILECLAASDRPLCSSWRAGNTRSIDTARSTLPFLGRIRSTGAKKYHK